MHRLLWSKIEISVSDVDSPCAEFDHGTPLHIAAANLAMESAKVLLQNGADLEARDDLGRAPLGRFWQM